MFLVVVTVFVIMVLVMTVLMVVVVMVESMCPGRDDGVYAMVLVMAMMVNDGGGVGVVVLSWQS